MNHLPCPAEDRFRPLRSPRRRRPWCALLLALAVISVTPADASPSRTRRIDLSVQHEDPVKVLDAVTLVFDNVNPLRYAVTVTFDSNELDGFDLSKVGLIPALSAVAASGGEGKSAELSSTDAETMKKIQAASGVVQISRNLAAVAKQPQSEGKEQKEKEKEIESRLRESAKKFNELQTKIATALADSEASLRSKQSVREAIEELVRHSDFLITTGDGRSEVVKTARELGEDAKNALACKPKSPVPLLEGIGQIEKKLRSLLQMDGWSGWQVHTRNSSRVRDLEEGLTALQSQLKPLEKQGALRKEADGLDAWLRAWRTVLAQVRADSFEIQRQQRCDFPLVKKREYNYKIVRIDRLQNDPSEALSVSTVAQVTCLPTLTVSAGIGLGKVAEREFGFVQASDGTGGVKNTIGLTSDSERNIAALALINARLLSFGSQRSYGFYLSAGTLLNLGDSLEGDRVGYVLGLSLSVGRRLFVTLGAEGRRVRELADGFALGADVPTGLNEVPTTKGWDFGSFLGLTVRLR